MNVKNLSLAGMRKAIGLSFRTLELAKSQLGVLSQQKREAGSIKKQTAAALATMQESISRNLSELHIGLSMSQPLIR